MSPKKTGPATGKVCFTPILLENGNSLRLCGTLQFPKQHFHTQASLVAHIQSVPGRELENRSGVAGCYVPLF